ncbi:B3 domain-containing protein Os07g0183200-like [Oryza brachyantha]|uniref:B3 domain-containing protein Os07g0183200-like n=1 Tax=Oryza brachyantha TaxID=4533 RepID=UPI001AD9D337|nr:B3 domain-containing protein Os07g0183200-like [Oryza brachyantha]
MAQPLAAGPRIVDRDMWLACANPKSGRLPAVGSFVYYFPYGHAEQCPSPLTQPLVCRQEFLCRVVAVRVSASAETNEPYAAISLKPDVVPDDDVPNPSPAPDQHHHQQPQIFYFVKELTYRDVDYRDLFVAPMSAANKVFPPPLEHKQTQDLSMRDLQGFRMHFKHRENRAGSVELRKGWRGFKKDMDLIDGDHVIFMRRPASDQLFVGVRRQRDVPKRVRPIKHRAKATTTVPLQEVMEAARLAAAGVEFTVNYYSRQDGDEFVVPHKVVVEGLKVWRARLIPAMVMKFSWAVQDDAPPIVGPQGKIVNIISTRVWRNLEVGWPQSSKMNRWTNFWQVRPILYPNLLSSSSPSPQKKLKISETATDLPSSSSPHPPKEPKISETATDLPSSSSPPHLPTELHISETATASASVEQEEKVDELLGQLFSKPPFL